LAAEADTSFLLPAVAFLAVTAGVFLDLELPAFFTLDDFFLLDAFLLPAPLRAVLAAALFLAFDVFFFETFFATSWP
jgi:hypothetical protein